MRDDYRKKHPGSTEKDSAGLSEASAQAQVGINGLASIKRRLTQAIIRLLDANTGGAYAPTVATIKR